MYTIIILLNISRLVCFILDYHIHFSKKFSMPSVIQIQMSDNIIFFQQFFFVINNNEDHRNRMIVGFMWQVGGFLRVLWFAPTIKLTAKI